MAGHAANALAPTYRRRHRRQRSHHRHSAYREPAMTFPDGVSGYAKSLGWWLMGAAAVGLMVFLSFAAQKDHDLFRLTYRLMGL